MRFRTIVLAITTTCLVACSTPVYRVTQPTMKPRQPYAHLDLSVRETIDKVVVLPHTSTAEIGLFGTYNEPPGSPTLAGMQAAEIPINFTLQGISSYGAGPFVTEFMIPYIILPIMLVGAMKQAIENQVQEMRDALADQLTDSAGRPVSNSVLAHDLYSKMRTVPGLDANVLAETTPLPQDTDAVLLVRLTEIAIEVDESEADIRTTATALLRRVSDGRVLYSREYFYKDRDTLRNWIANDAALWGDYMNFARHYFARQITADFFDKIELRHDLHPVSADLHARGDGNSWQRETQTTMPSLAWEYVRMGDDAYAPSVLAFGEGDTYYDLEIYDQHRLVYVARDIPGRRHEVNQPLPECRELRWTVRPAFHVSGDVRFGEWMRFYSTVYLNEGYVGTRASETPAYLRGFAVVKTPCRG